MPVFSGIYYGVIDCMWHYGDAENPYVSRDNGTWERRAFGLFENSALQWSGPKCVNK